MPSTEIKILPNGQRIRMGSKVVVSYWDSRDVTAKVIGWRPGEITVDHDSEHQEGLDVADGCVDEVLTF